MATTLRVSRGAWLFAWSGAAAFAASLAFFLYCYLARFGAPAARPGTLVPLVLDAALFTLFALHHSLFARPFVKRRLFGVRPGSDPGLTPIERSTYVWLASVLFIVVCATWQPVPGELYRVSGALALAAYAVHVAGVVLTARASARLDVLDLAGVRAVSRSGPAAHVPLQTGGVYGFVRHPLYFAWVLMVFGTPHLTFTRLAFAAISTAYLAIAIPLEERALVATFGAEYREYQQRVRWRMLPGLY
jgi:protein-S-isoprenylcysteine O-methyltransferase Ste14